MLIQCGQTLQFQTIRTKQVLIMALNENLSVTPSNVFVTSSKDNFPVQLGAFRIKSNAESLYNKIITELGNDARIVFEDGLYKVRIAKAPDSSKTDVPHKKVIAGKPVVEKQDSIVKPDTTVSQASVVAA